MFEVEDPSSHDIFTYLKIKTYVRFKNDEGIINSYFIDKKNLFYEIKDKNIIHSNKVKLGAVGKKDKKAFVAMKSPIDFGVITKFNINDFVEVKPNSENKLDKSYLGFLVWMGFDGDSILKFLIKLDDPCEHGTDGTFFGQKLHDIKYKHGLLVKPDWIIPFGHVPDMNSSSYQTNIGTVLQFNVKLRSLESPLRNKFIVFQINSFTYKGIVKWFGLINDIRTFGIETDSVEIGTNDEFNNKKIFIRKSECGILIEESVKYLEIEESHGFIKYKEFKVDKKYANSLSRLVYVKYKDECRIGRILNGGFINEIICFHIEVLKESIDYFVIKNDILQNFVSDDGIVSLSKGAVLNIENSDEGISMIINKRVQFQHENKTEIGVLKWKGKIDGLKCIAVDPDNSALVSNWKIHFDRDGDVFWAVICLDFLEEKGSPIMFEVEDPSSHDIFTYLKINTYVRFKNDEGIINSYFIDKKNLFYEIKDKNIIINSNKVKLGAVAREDKKAFVTMKSPIDYGVITKFNINDFVEVKPNSENKLDKSYLGFLVWMGFDGDSTLKFLIKLDDPCEHGTEGTFYGQKLHDIKYKHGLLVKPDWIIPFGHVPGNENQNCPENSPIVVEYQSPRSKITSGENKGIQGDTNSCYMDTSLFAMFTFQELFDNLLILPQDNESREVVNILRSKIIFPLRKYEYVSFKSVSEFRKILGTLYPDKKFLHSEKDPEELLETLFHRLTPHDPLLRTYDIKSGNFQNCFMTQLFYTNKFNSSVATIKEMLNRTFLEGGILINKPPRCLILQLPRHGTQFKQYTEVEILPTLDITELVRCGEHGCSQCSRYGTRLCLTCSEEQQKFTYFCKDHKLHCIHPKSKIIENEKPLFEGKIRLDLFAILCIEKTHYVAYVKTGEVHDKWIYYDSMATSDKHVLKPLIRDTLMGKYFTKKNYHSDINEDLIRIKKFAFVCFYKNPSLEYYRTDFNHFEK